MYATLTAAFPYFPDFHIDVTAEYDTLGCSIREVTITGTHLGPYREIPLSGKRNQFELADFYLLKRGQSHALLMARKLRVEYPGAIYHVMNRGDRREDIFLTDNDRKLFLETLGEACVRAGWRVFAYCLMPNHFHLVIETPRANLVAGMKWFLGTYTSRFNRRHKLFGPLFCGRYKSLIVDGSGNGYLKTVSDYVHLNPIRAKVINDKSSLSDFRWSSYSQYLLPAFKDPRGWEWNGCLARTESQRTVRLDERNSNGEWKPAARTKRTANRNRFGVVG